MTNFNTLQDFPAFLDRLYTHDTDFDQRERMPFPPINIGEDSRAIYIRALTPGVDMEALSLTLSDNALIIEGELSPQSGRYFRQERFTGPFRRVVALKVPVRREGVTAKLHDGILEIVLPKAPIGRFITIQSRP